MAAGGVQHLCASGCSSAAPLRCARCRVTFYCSPECQRGHWPEHKKVCPKTEKIKIQYEPEFSARPGGDALIDGGTADLVQIRKDSGQCSCSRCAGACRYFPGFYDPSHLVRMREQWLVDGKSKAAFYRRLMPDYYVGQDEDVWALRPRNSSEAASGRTYPSFLPRGDCSNLGPEGCKLLREEMPLECVSSFGCSRGLTTRSIGKKESLSVWGRGVGLELMEDYRRTVG